MSLALFPTTEAEGENMVAPSGLALELYKVELVEGAVTE
ncbi:hypothetical protein L195_g051000, partial [Trifolium pratense]